MAAYAVIARIGRVDPQLTLRDLDVDLDRDTPDPPRPRGGVQADEPAVIDRFDGPTLGERISDQVSMLRETLGQMTFYLFDPESWRR
jgi:hypothetical protein